MHFMLGCYLHLDRFVSRVVDAPIGTMPIPASTLVISKKIVSATIFFCTFVLTNDKSIKQECLKLE